MLKLRNLLPKWMAALRGENTDGRREGSNSESTELLTLGSRVTQEGSNFLPSVWKPVWYTGWHTGVLVCATSVVVVLFINIGLTIYAATNPKHRIEGGIGTLYLGSCDESRTIGMWLHLGINFLSTLLLSGSNYTQQCLAAPTRSEIDAAHARRRWMDIGVPSVRNLFRIQQERAWLWVAIGVTSIPLHLLYNSAVFNSIASNGFSVTLVTNKYFEQAPYSNMTEVVFDFYLELYKATNRTIFTIHQEAQLASVLEGYNANPEGYENLTPHDCMKLYDTDFMSSHRNLFLIAKNGSNATQNDTLLNIGIVSAIRFPRSSWMCGFHQESVGGIHNPTGGTCNPSELISNVVNGLPWRVQLPTEGEVDISGCKSERTPKPEKCKVQFSVVIMIAVIGCNFVKACSMVIAVVRSREPTLVTLGDAVDSFLRDPDPTTTGMCFADRQFAKREWRHGWRTGPRQWKQRGVQRWWTSVSKTRWITCNFFCLIAIIIVGVLLRMGIVREGNYSSTDISSMYVISPLLRFLPRKILRKAQNRWTRGFGKVRVISILLTYTTNIRQAILIANLPQTILSFLYLTYNSLFTCMLSGHEWSLFGHRHRSLRVTSPRPGQRSTYWLQLPHTYAIPLMTLSGLLHWLTSQSIFLARIEIWDLLGREIPITINTIGYSCIAIISFLTLWILALLTVAGMGYRRFAAETTTVGSCSAAVSAACHAWEDSDVIIGKKVRWGDVGIGQNVGLGI
ncbi:hypothetical protein HOY82DRAFT_626498 [Tuber indicum]|nr:hypothetical protein HOY82DRAFT_626498 [Tuber indicum]